MNHGMTGEKSIQAGKTLSGNDIIRTKNQNS